MRVTMIGGGMIAHDQILPSLYQLQRKGVIESIAISVTAAPRLSTCSPRRPS